VGLNIGRFCESHLALHLSQLLLAGSPARGLQKLMKLLGPSTSCKFALASARGLIPKKLAIVELRRLRSRRKTNQIQ